jgi:hypothetical protein
MRHELKKIEMKNRITNKWILLCLLPMLFFILTNMAIAEGSFESQQSIQQKADADKNLGGRFSIYGDLGGKINPRGLAFWGGVKYRNSYRYDAKYDAISSYWQTSVSLVISPAFMLAGVHAEWMPWLFLQMHVQYDYIEYLGINDSLLSFPSANSPYGDEVRKDRHDEEKTHGSRIMFQPTIQGKVDSFIIRNQTDLAYYTFAGRGPYFFELWYDTLMKDGDCLVANRTQFLYAFLDRKRKKLLAGPYYEVTKAFDTQITQQKLGVALYWEPASSLFHISHPHLGVMSGYHLEDPNRQGQFYFIVGAGFEFDL